MKLTWKLQRLWKEQWPKNVSEPGLRETTQDRLLFPVTDGQSTTDNLHNMTLPSANTFRTINSEDR